MEKNNVKSPWIKYILLVSLGLVLGWVLFKGNDAEHASTDQHTHVEGTVWTCSMHPQIRQSEPGDCPLCGMDLIPASGSTSKKEANLYVHEMTPEAVALSNIRTSRVDMISAEHEIILSGKVKLNEQNRASITSNFPGRIEKLHVDFTGQEVNRGQRLATLYSPELITAQKELLEAAKTKESNRLLYDAAKEKLRLLKINEGQIREIEERGEVNSRFDIYADISGVVTNRFVSEGDYISRGSVMFEIADLSQLWIMLDAYESDLSFISVGDKVTYAVSALPGKEMTAKVDYIDPVLNPATRTASVRAEVDNSSLHLKPEMFVNARITTQMDTENSGIAIPKSALLWTGKRSVVYTKVPDTPHPAFELKEILLGQRMGDFYLVESGLSVGDEVVTNGVFAVDASAQLSGNYSMMARPEITTMETPDAFQRQLTQALEAYLDVKNALVASDENQTASLAQDLAQALEEVDMEQLSGKTHDSWMQLLKPLKESARSISETNAIEDQRESFETLSNNMIKAVELFGVQLEKVYKDYCPMAAGDKGAFWLSEVAEIRNPYYGEDMLTCGEITATYGQTMGTHQNSVQKASDQDGHQH